MEIMAVCKLQLFCTPHTHTPHFVVLVFTIFAVACLRDVRKKSNNQMAKQQTELLLPLLLPLPHHHQCQNYCFSCRTRTPPPPPPPHRWKTPCHPFSTLHVSATWMFCEWICIHLARFNRFLCLFLANFDFDFDSLMQWFGGLWL